MAAVIADDGLAAAVAVRVDEDDEAVDDDEVEDEAEEALGAIDFGCFFLESTAGGG